MVITLCGSARFEKLFHEWNKKLTLAGHVVFSLAAFPSVEGGKMWYDDSQKEILDAIHKAKISNSDAIVVLNQYGYIGPSTQTEVHWAQIMNKDIYVLEWWGKGYGPGNWTGESDEFRKQIIDEMGKYPKSPIATDSFAKATILLKGLV